MIKKQDFMISYVYSFLMNKDVYDHLCTTLRSLNVEEINEIYLFWYIHPAKKMQEKKMIEVLKVSHYGNIEKIEGISLDYQKYFEERFPRHFLFLKDIEKKLEEVFSIKIKSFISPIEKKPPSFMLIKEEYFLRFPYLLVFL